MVLISRVASWSRLEPIAHDGSDLPKQPQPTHHNLNRSSLLILREKKHARKARVFRRHVDVVARVLISALNFASAQQSYRIGVSSQDGKRLKLMGSAVMLSKKRIPVRLDALICYQVEASAAGDGKEYAINKNGWRAGQGSKLSHTTDTTCRSSLNQLPIIWGGF